MRTTILALLLSATARCHSGPSTSSRRTASLKPDFNIKEHAPGTGILVATKSYASLSIAVFSNARYLNQLSTDAYYTDAFGRTYAVQRRNDLACCPS
jgi:hypothetical protein